MPPHLSRVRPQFSPPRFGTSVPFISGNLWGDTQRFSRNIRRRSSMAIAWRKTRTLGFVRVYGSVRSAGTSRSRLGTITVETADEPGVPSHPVVNQRHHLAIILLYVEYAKEAGMDSRRPSASGSSRRSSKTKPGDPQSPDQSAQTQASDQSLRLGEIGEPPGSPGYYGEVGRPELAGAQAEIASSGPGDPPGSPAYYGGSEPAATATASPAETALPMPTVGEPPGSPGYYGEVGRPELAGAQAEIASGGPGDPPGSPAYYGGSEPAATATAGPGATVGEPPGSAAYFGKAGTAGYQGVSAPTEATNNIPASSAAWPLPTVGEAPGSKSYYGAT